MEKYNYRWYVIVICIFIICVVGVDGLGVNWGTQASHLLPGDVVVRMLKDNGFKKVKLFEADPRAMVALGGSGIEVMVGIPNELLVSLASSVQTAENWVMHNVSQYVSKYGVDIRYVAVGNEPLLKTYNGTFLTTTFPALENIQAAIIKAGLSRQVKVTIPLNADVYESSNGLPSGGDFRADIHDLMISIVEFLSMNGGPFTINIYPFLSLYDDPHFPVDYAFFEGAASPVVDGTIAYTNVFDANHDTLIWALEKNGFGSLAVMIGEVGWPTDGNKNANSDYARRFNQGFISRLLNGQGTPKRPNAPDAYLFGLIDEDQKSIAPGNFERHWGIFYFDGTLKYTLDLGSGRSLVAAKGVKYLAKQWCVLSPSASITDTNLAGAIDYACTNADCTSLGYGSSCSNLDVRGNASYAFNIYYQTFDQKDGECEFSSLSIMTHADPSQNGCKFPIMISSGSTKSRKLYIELRDRSNVRAVLTTTLAVILFFIL